MSENGNISKAYKGIDIYNEGKEFASKEEERINYIQGKLMKFFKKITDSIYFSSDNKGHLYYIEFNKDTEKFKITNLEYICNDSKYILVDLIKSDKYDFYFSLDLNPCLNIFKIKENNNKTQVDIIQHKNLRKNQNRNKYNKLYETNLPNNDCLILFGENIIEIWSNNIKNKNVNYEFIQIIKIDDNINNENNINDDEINNNIITSIYKIDNENYYLFNPIKFQIIQLNISEIKSDNKENEIIPLMEIKNKINIKAIDGQIEKISCLFFDKNYVFLGLFDSLVVSSITYGEILQKYKIGQVNQIKLTKDKKHIYVFVKQDEKKYFFIKYKFIDNEGLNEEKRITYDSWIYKFDIIEEKNLIVIYNVKGLISLLNFE